MIVRTIPFEIVRHGPPDNQLLSPLTPYLIFSGNHEAVTINVPWTQRHFSQELRDLRGGGAHEAPDRSRVTDSDMIAIGERVGQMLKDVPGLWHDLAKASDADLVQLRLICNAAELALVPFEMAIPPQGFRDSRDPLLLRRDPPLVITREIRGIQPRRGHWPTKPRILFAYASPTEFPVDDNLIAAHLQALVESLRPWMGPPVDDADEAPLQRLKGLLTVVPDATLGALRAAMREGRPYTHVHILAHGQRYEEGDFDHYGLALEPEEPGAPPVSAGQLLSVLTRPLDSSEPGRNTALPTVVTLAACDSAASAQVIFPSSLAHRLHAAGIPLVVASLYPLWPRASVTLVETLYTSLLRGDDPREALRLTRDELATRGKSFHDWAGMVAYAVFPDDIASLSRRLRYESSRTAIANLNQQIETLIARRSRSHERLAELLAGLDVVATRMPVDGGYEIEGPGMLASKDKRKAYALFRMAKDASRDAKQGLLAASFEALRAARDNYAKASETRTRNPHDQWMSTAPHWVMTQYLSLEAALGNRLRVEDWRQAHAAAVIDLTSKNPNDVVWAHGSLVEIYLLCGLIQRPEGPSHLPDVKLCRDEASKSAGKVAEGGRRDKFFVTSTEEQIRKYLTWWSTPDWIAHVRERGASPDAAAWSWLKAAVQELLDELTKSQW